MIQRPLAQVCTLILTAALIVVAFPDAANAGGFSAARFGGERGNPTEANPFSIYYNPGGLGLTDGTQLTIDASLVFRSAKYDRPVPVGSEPGSADATLNAGENSLNNFLVSPAFALVTDFGGISPVKFGLGVYFPFGGSAVWDTVEGDDEFPGAKDGSQRWYSIDGTIRTTAISAGLGYNVESLNLSFGVTGNLYLSVVDTLRARNGDGSDDLAQEGRSWVKGAENTSFGFGLGVLWEAIEDRFWVGVSYQSRPGGGTLEYEGQLVNLLGASQRAETDIRFYQDLPDVIRFGGRYKVQDNLELRLFADYTRWSVFDQQCLINASNAGDPESSCAINANGSRTNPDAPNVIQILKRDWNDTYGVRVGASYWIMPSLEILVGGGYDSNAIPDANLDPALYDMDKFTASLGVQYDFTQFMALMITATNVFYVERDTVGAATNDTLELPSKQPSSEGVYNQNIFLINTNLTFSF